MYNYSEAIKCMACGSDDITQVHSSSGIIYCTCNLCGKKFVVQTEGVDLLDQYLSARAKIFRELEMTQIGRKSSAVQERVRQELENLIQSFAVIAEIDTIYNWYKIVLITKNFTDFTNFDEAQREFAKLPADECYLVAAEDVVRNERYKKQYDDYVAKIQNDMYQYSVDIEQKKIKKKKTAKILAISLACILMLAAIGLGVFTTVYTPTFSNNDCGVVVEPNMLSFGWIGKFKTQMQVKALTQNDGEFANVGEILQDETGKFTPYDLQFLQGGKKYSPKDKFTVTMPIPKGYNLSKVEVYIINSDGTYEEVQCVISKENYTVRFVTQSTGVFVIAEKPYVITFDSAGGEEVGAQKIEGGQLMANAVTERVGYTFAGWYEGESVFDISTPITKDTTLTARWIANEYMIYYYIDGEPVKSQKVTYDVDMQLYVPERRGYSAEWYKDQVKFNDSKWTIANDVNLNVKWIADSVNLTFFNYTVGSGSTLVNNRFNVKVFYDDKMPKVTPPSRRGYVFKGYYFDGDTSKKLVYNNKGECSLTCDFINDTKLRALWDKDPVYADYKYIESKDDLTEVRALASGKFLLLCDLDLEGASWTPFPTFSGTFDGGSHCIYNFNISVGSTGADKTQIQLGFFAYLADGTIKNLQIGKAGQAKTTIKFNQNNLRGMSGMIVGEIGSGGVVDNCRAENCHIDLYTFTNNKTYGGWDWDQKAGGICGYATNGSAIKGCFATNIEIANKSETRYNGIKAFARTGGICGYMKGVNSSIQDCLVKNVTLNSYATAISGSWDNKTGAPQAKCGGIVGEFYKSTITRCVSVSSAIKSTNSGGGTAYWGSILGWTEDTHPSSLFRINISLQYSGSNKSYGAGKELATDSFADLVATDSTFNNGYWISDNGKIAIDFHK